MKPLEKPMTEEEILKAISDEDGTAGRLTVDVKVAFGDLISRDLDALNEFMDELILPAQCERIAPCLSGIEYRVVGHVEEPLDEQHFTSGYVILEVSGEVEVYE